jgi:ABC-type branched-subunit amino acid transport system substrate-binding protein
MRRHTRAVTMTACLALTGIVVGLEAGASNPPTPGVTSTEVDLGAIVTQSGFLAADFKPYVEGVRAYLNYVNTTLHGVHGRQIDLTDVQDDDSNPTTDVSETRAMASSSSIFAIVGYATAFFDSKDLAKTGIPTFGYATTTNWQGPSNFFADDGSATDFASIVPDYAYVAKQIGVAKVAVLAYPKTIDAEAYGACADAVSGLKHYGRNVVYSNLAEQVFASSYSTDVTKMLGDKVDFVISCMQAGDNVTLGEDTHDGGMAGVPQIWLDGYDRTLLSHDYTDMDNVYFLLQHIPFDALTDYPSAYPGLTLYLNQMTSAGYGSDEYDDVALMGWESANLFTEGLRAAGANPTRAAVISAINKITADTGGPTGDGVASPTNWKVAHKKDTSPGCVTFVKTADTTSSGSAHFQMVFNKGSDPWICFPLTGANIAHPVAPPKGTPAG